MPQSESGNIHASIKKALRLKTTLSDAAVLKHVRKLKALVCKPCWELKYCPYGPLVEQMPHLPTSRDVAIAHNKHISKILVDGQLPDGNVLDEDRKAMFTEWVKNFDPADHPLEIPSEIEELPCNVFGHICPVFFAAEPLTETAEDRRRGRQIPFKTKMRVVRRDNHTCQRCGEHLRDDEVEFDHIIPVAKGGSSEEHNIRLTCFKCNRNKSDNFSP